MWGVPRVQMVGSQRRWGALLPIAAAGAAGAEAAFTSFSSPQSLARSLPRPSVLNVVARVLAEEEGL